MKNLKVILLIILISKVSFGASMASLISTNCCSAPIEQVCDDNTADHEEEEEGCCNGASCNCTCCGHIFLSIDQSQTKVIPIQNFTLINFSYNDNYSFASQNSIWQPPKNL